MSFDSTRIINQMNLKGSLPEGRFSDQELLDFAYDSLLSEIVPVVLMAREDYFVTYADQAVTQNQAAYPIPTRALNGVVREVKLLKDNCVVNLTRTDVDKITTTQTGDPKEFYTLGDSLYLYPTPSATTGTLRIYYFQRPSKLVPASECARITAIDTGTNSVTVSIPTGWTTADTFDLVRGKAHFDVLALDLTASSVGSGAITFSSLPSDLAVGDYVTLAEESCFPRLPPEGHVALIQSAVTAALESLGDSSAIASANKTTALLQAFKAVLSTRVQGEFSLGKPLLL